MTLRPVTIAELAVMIGRPYDWAQRHWRELPIVRLEQPGQPRFARPSVEAWLAGQPLGAGGQITPSTNVHTAQPATNPANDASPFIPPDTDTRLQRAFGGR